MIVKGELKQAQVEAITTAEEATVKHARGMFYLNYETMELLLSDGTILKRYKPAVSHIDLTGLNIDWSVGDSFSRQITGNESYAFVNEVNGKVITVVIENTTGGSLNVTFPTAKWPYGIPLTVVKANSRTLFTFVNQNSVIIANAVEDIR